MNSEVMNRALSRIESFLLPNNNDKSLKNKVTNTNKSDIPSDRLEETLSQVSIADHIRVMQTMYRDNHDEQNLGSEFRTDSKNIKLPIKYLMKKITEGRSRIISLIKIAYGENTPALLKGYLDLANTYAIQGMWPQVEEKITLMSELMRKINLTTIKTYDIKFLLAKMAAERLCCVYDTLREHAISNHGLITKQYIKEVLVLLMNIHNQSDRSAENFLGHPSKFATSLLTLFLTKSQMNPRKTFTESYYHDIDKANKVEGNHNNTNNNNTNTNNIAGQNNNEITKSWGEVVEFLRDHCDSIRTWLELIDDILLPQNKSVLLLPFSLCDLQCKYIAHPMQLADTILTFPATARILVGSKLPKILSQIKVEVPLFIDSRNGSVVDLNKANSISKTNNNNSSQQVNYELPITIEEFIALYVISTSHSIQNQIELLKVQLYTIQGIYNIYSENLEAAEEYLKKSLNILESLGMEMEIVACELYNSIAQMMILKHRNWLTTRKLQVREEADQWLDTTNEGKRALRVELKQIKQQYDYKSPMFVTSAEIEMRAKTNLIRLKMTELLNNSDESKKMNSILQAAYRYLVRSLEILELVHGTSHPSVGTACLAVASVQNILENYEDTREWLMRALKHMERYHPCIPHRAISFTKIQLSQVLTKLGHEDQARMLLASAASFHLNQAQLGLLQLNNTRQKHINLPKKSNVTFDTTNNNTIDSENGLSPSQMIEETLNYSIVSPLIFNESPLHEEINVAIDIMSKVMRMSTKANDKWNAVVQAEEIAKLTSAAYGWDSIQAAEAYKQAGIRCAAIQDWNRAYKYLKESLDAMLLLYGKSDSRTIEIAKLLYSAKKYRTNDQHINQQKIQEDVLKNQNKIVNDENNYEIDLINHINHHDNLFKQNHMNNNNELLHVITTPKTIELQKSNHINKDVLDLIETSNQKDNDIINIDFMHSMIKAANI